MCVNPKVTWNNLNVIQTTSVGSSEQKPFIDSKEITEQRLAIRSESLVQLSNMHNLYVQSLKVEWHGVAHGYFGGKIWDDGNSPAKQKADVITLDTLVNLSNSSCTVLTLNPMNHSLALNTL